MSKKRIKIISSLNIPFLDRGSNYCSHKKSSLRSMIPSPHTPSSFLISSIFLWMVINNHIATTYVSVFSCSNHVGYTNELKCTAVEKAHA